MMRAKPVECDSFISFERTGHGGCVPHFRWETQVQGVRMVAWNFAHPRSHYRRLLLSVGKVGSGTFGCALSLVVYLAKF